MYTALERLETKGLIASRMSDPTPLRGGCAKRQVTCDGRWGQALTRAMQARTTDYSTDLTSLWREVNSVTNAVEGLLSLFTSSDRAEAIAGDLMEEERNADRAGFGCTLGYDARAVARPRADAPFALCSLRRRGARSLPHPRSAGRRGPCFPHLVGARVAIALSSSGGVERCGPAPPLVIAPGGMAACATLAGLARRCCWSGRRRGLRPV